MRKKSPYERKKEGEEGGKGAIFVLSRSGGIEDKATREEGGPLFSPLYSIDECIITFWRTLNKINLTEIY